MVEIKEAILYTVHLLLLPERQMDPRGTGQRHHQELQPCCSEGLGEEDSYGPVVSSSWEVALVCHQGRGRIQACVLLYQGWKDQDIEHRSHFCCYATNICRTSHFCIFHLRALLGRLLCWLQRDYWSKRSREGDTASGILTVAWKISKKTYLLRLRISFFSQ